MQAVAVLVSGFVASYFWTAATVIYLLLRQVDDATDFHEVYMPDEKEADDLLPLVGVAASDQPVIERPPEGDFAAPRRPRPPFVLRTARETLQPHRQRTDRICRRRDSIAYAVLSPERDNSCHRAR